MLTLGGRIKIQIFNKKKLKAKTAEVRKGRATDRLKGRVLKTTH